VNRHDGRLAAENEARHLGSIAQPLSDDLVAAGAGAEAPPQCNKAGGNHDLTVRYKEEMVEYRALPGAS
jgi:hypothetical protein